MSGAVLALIIVCGTLGLIGLVAVGVVAGIGGMTKQQMATLTAEGIERDSGRVSIRANFRGYRVPGVYMGVGVHVGAARLVLTSRRLAFVPAQLELPPIAREALSAFRVSARDGRLLLQTDSPPNGSGSMDVAVAVADVESWVGALTAAGAQRG